VCFRAYISERKFLSSLGVKPQMDKVELCGEGKESLELIHAIIE
jgi:hypothetical protein